ncbi:MAG TPA: tetratricopeptide repeat protein [Candidatus Ozemobacteraceae bacterium]|nr:tetratricopeptide repeat protein [Candidatus Ozemobacteraceae bacterium]
MTSVIKNICVYIVVALAFVPAGSALASVSGEVDAGLRALGAGRLEEAEAALQRARFAAPDDPRILYDLGIVAFHARRYDEAAGLFRRTASSTAAAPKLVGDALHNLGNAAFHAGRFADAVDAYQAALAQREEPDTRYNLEQAQKRLAEAQAAESARQEPQQDQQGQQGQQDQQSQQGKQGQQGQQDQQGKQDQQGQQGQQGQEGQQGGQNQQGEKSGNQEAGSPGEQRQSGEEKTSGQSRENGSNASQTASAENQPPVASGTASDTSRPLFATASAELPKEGTASDSTPWSGQDAKLRDVEMWKNAPGHKNIPDESERARALRNRKLNPYQVERILRQMEERERDIQLRYRRDPQSNDIDDPFADPFFMDPERMREFMEGRRGGRRQTEPDTPDW